MGVWQQVKNPTPYYSKGNLNASLYQEFFRNIKSKQKNPTLCVDWTNCDGPTCPTRTCVCLRVMVMQLQVSSPHIRLCDGQEHQGAKRRWQAEHLCSLNPTAHRPETLNAVQFKAGLREWIFWFTKSHQVLNHTQGKEMQWILWGFFPGLLKLLFFMQNNSNKKVKSRKQGHPLWIFSSSCLHS